MERASITHSAPNLTLSDHRMMTGKQIFDKFQWAAHIYGPGSAEFLYGNLLFEALRLHGEDLLFPLLEEAETTGKRIDLVYPPTEEGSDSEPIAVLILM